MTDSDHDDIRSAFTLTSQQTPLETFDAFRYFESGRMPVTSRPATKANVARVFLRASEPNSPDWHALTEILEHCEQPFPTVRRA